MGALSEIFQRDKSISFPDFVFGSVSGLVPELFRNRFPGFVSGFFDVRGFPLIPVSAKKTPIPRTNKTLNKSEASRKNVENNELE